MNNNNHAYLSTFKYLSNVPEKFYNEAACRDILNFLNDIKEKKPSSLVKILNSNEFQSIGYKSLNEINSLKFHDMAIPSNEYDLMRFCNNHIHPNYLKLVEGVYSNLIFPIGVYHRIERGKRLEGFDIYNRVEELKMTTLYKYLSDPYNHTIRNAIAHGKVVFKHNDISYKDRDEEFVLSYRDTINLFDDMLDISNGLSLGFCLFYFTNLEFLEKHDIMIPLPIMIEELKAETNATGWKIRGYLESETIDNRSQLIIFAKNCFLDRVKLNYHVFRSAIFAEKFSPGYQRYFISLDSKYSLPGWAAFDGSKLCKLRNKHIDNIQDYYTTLESIYFHPKFKLPRFVFKVVTFFSIIWINLPITLLEFNEKFYKLSIKPRDVKIHQNKFHSVISGSVIVKPNSNIPIDELIRNYSGSIIRKTIKKARKKAKITDISKYLPVGYLRISIYSKDFRVRKLKNSGLIPELLCTIELKRLRRIQTIDIIGGRPEKINKYRIVWNENAKIIE